MCEVTRKVQEVKTDPEWEVDFEMRESEGVAQLGHQTRLPELSAASCYVVRVASSALLVLRGSR